MILPKADNSGNKIKPYKIMVNMLIKLIKGLEMARIMSFTPESVEDIGAISTGSLALDAATGIGGVPRGTNYRNYGDGRYW